jgi:hypothetical protein
MYKLLGSNCSTLLPLKKERLKNKKRTKIPKEG